MRNRAHYCYRLSLIILISFAVFEHTFCQSQSSPYILSKRFLSVEDGLASREVLCGLQDKWGFIWLGTRNGLNRYDGKNFVLFSTKTGLRSNTIAELWQPDPKELWLIYNVSSFSKAGGGIIDIMNPLTQELKSFTQTFPDCPFPESELLSMKSLGNGDYILLTKQGYYKYFPSTRTFEKQFDQYADTGQYLGSYHIFYRNYAYIYDAGENIYCYKDGKRQSIFGNILRNNKEFRLLIGIEKNGDVTALRKNQYTTNFLKINTAGEETQATTIQNLTHTPFRTEGNLFWMNYDAETNSSVMIGNSLCLYENNVFYELMDSAAMSTLPNFILYDYFVDSQHNKWVCTSIGLFVFSKKKNNFQSLFNDSATIAFQRKFNQARGIFTDEKGDVYAGIGGSICHSNAKGEMVSQFLPIEHFKKDNRLHTDIVYGLTRDKKIYAGLTNELWIMNPDFTEVESIITRDTLSELFTIYRLDDRRLMVGCHEGYFVYDKIENKIILSRSIPGMFLYRITRDNNGNLFGAGALGVYEFSHDGEIKKHYYSGAREKSESLPYSDLMDLYIDKAGIFWLATNGDGLYRWDKAKHAFEHFIRDDGLSSNLLYGILEDEFNNLWISSDFGLNRFHKSTHQVTTYSTKDGIINNDFNRTSLFKAPDGKMYFGGVNGVNSFYPKDFQRDSSQFNAPLRIVSFNQFIGSENKLIDKTIDLNQQQAITLHPGDQFFTLEFQLLDFEKSRNHYAYIIEGIDKEWNYISENAIRISGLPYGNFKLHIKGQNFEGAWSKNELVIPLSVLTPFYKTTWFYVTALFLLMGMIYLVMHWRTSNLKKANARLEETVGNRTAELQDSLKQKDILLKEIHHRVKNNLQVISSLLELQSANVEGETAKAALIEGQTRVRSIALIHHKLYEQDTVGQVEFSGFLKDLCRQVASVFEKEENLVETSYQIPEAYFDIDTIVPLGLLINELFTNSFKYAFTKGKYGKISLGLKAAEKGNYHLTYHDNGPGLPNDFNLQKATSMGLRLVYRLGKQLGGNVSYDRKQNTFTIHFKDSMTRKQDA